MSMKTGKSITRGFAGFILVFLVAMMMSMSVSAASSVKLNKTSASVVVGKTVQLSVKNTSKTVKWSSSKKSVATVSSSGKVTAKKAGTATITAKVGSKKLTCKITVKANVWNNKYGTGIYSYTNASWRTIATCNNSQLAFVYAQPLQVYYNSKGQLVAKIVILNKTYGTNYNLNKISVSIKKTNGTVIAKGTFNLKNTVTINPFGYAEYELTFDGGSTKKVVNLNNTKFQWAVQTN